MHGSACAITDRVPGSQPRMSVRLAVGLTAQLHRQPERPGPTGATGGADGTELAGFDI